MDFDIVPQPKNPEPLQQSPVPTPKPETAPSKRLWKKREIVLICLVMVLLGFILGFAVNALLTGETVFSNLSEE